MSSTNFFSFFSLLVFFLLPGYAATQPLNLSVVGNSGDAVPYATVFAVALEKGLITDENGQFTLDWENAADTTTVIISSVGFQTVSFSYQQLGKLASARQPSGEIAKRLVRGASKVLVSGASASKR